MTDHAYTDADLRTEAARQHYTATTDPDFMGIGERMDGSPIESTFYDAAGQRHENGRVWDQLDEDDWDTAQRAVDDLLGKAADVSEWAINLGADGLEPEEHEVTLKADERPIVRVHFAFAPDLSDITREAVVMGIGEVAAHGLGLVDEEPDTVTIPSEVAAHVLFQERLGGWPPSTFASKLLNLWTSADTANADHLAVAFPAYAAAIALVKSGLPGVQQLRAISGDS